MTTESKPTHIPGPWIACLPENDRQNGGYKRAIRCKKGRRFVADVPANSPMEDDTALLISAAPDLLEACRVAEQLAAIASDWNLDEVEIDGEMKGIHDVRAIFVAALNKAKGGA